MNRQQDTESAYLLDFSAAVNSVQAFQLLEEFLTKLPHQGGDNALIDINASDLLLTRGVMTKICQQLRMVSLTPNVMYAVLPQTQQAALDEGWMVKLKPSTFPSLLRQSLYEFTPQQRPSQAKGASSSRSGIDLPAFPGTGPQHGMSIPRSKPSSILSLNKRSEPTFEPQTTQQNSSQGQATSSEAEVLQMHPAVQAQSQATFQAVAPQSNTIPELGNAVMEPETVNSVQAALTQESTNDFAGLSDSASTELCEVEYSDAALQTLYWRQNLRSGQTVRFEGNIVIVGDVHAGSEVTAGGDILVWGELRGVAHAGAQGNFKAEIRAMRIEALQLRIADYIARRPDRIYYHKEDADSAFAPEIARVGDGEIKIYKTRSGRI